MIHLYRFPMQYIVSQTAYLSISHYCVNTINLIDTIKLKA